MMEGRDLTGRKRQTWIEQTSVQVLHRWQVARLGLSSTVPYRKSLRLGLPLAHPT